MELEYKTEMVPITESFQDDIGRLVADHWEILPGTKPVAIYHLVRIKAQVPQAAAVGGMGTLKIDESKISIIRGGKVVRPDGTVEGEAKVLDINSKLG